MVFDKLIVMKSGENRGADGACGSKPLCEFRDIPGNATAPFHPEDTEVVKHAKTIGLDPMDTRAPIHLPAAGFP